jgi:hypothetical protein
MLTLTACTFPLDLLAGQAFDPRADLERCAHGQASHITLLRRCGSIMCFQRKNSMDAGALDGIGK